MPPDRKVRHKGKNGAGGKMMKWFDDLKISSKLITGFVIVAIFGGLIGLFGIINLNRITREDSVLYTRDTRALMFLGELHSDFLMMRLNMSKVLLDEANKRQYIEVVHGDRRQIADKINQFEQSDVIERQKIEDLNASIQKYDEMADQGINLVLAGQQKQGNELMVGPLAKQGDTVETQITKLYKFNQQDAKMRAGANVALADKTILIMGVVIVVMLLAAIALGLYISRKVSRSVGRIVEAAKAVSAGSFDFSLAIDTRDEIGELAGALRRIGETLTAFMSEMGNMSRQHELGDIDVFVAEEKFQGGYRTMAKGVNDMVAGHISVKKKAMACVAEFAKGNFDAELERFPGKKAFINENIEHLRQNVKNFIAAMNYMSSQHDLGDIDVVVPEESFQGAYQIMAKGVNTMVAGHISVKKKAMACVAEFAKGNFDAELERFPGKKAFINENMEELRRNLRAINGEINQLVTASIEGKLDTRANDAAFTGDWQKLMQGLNRLLQAIIEPVQEAATVLAEMANGNLQLRVKGEYKGDHAAIKNAMNSTLDTLAAYVGEISEVLKEMANSNLDVGIHNEYKGDFVRIKDALNLIIKAFNEVLAEINSSADQVAGGARQVSDGSQALAQGATEQASSIEELTASIEEISAQTEVNASSAKQANELAETARQNALRGDAQMKEMLQAMADINEASASISKIIKVIDEIAFQTNILALNAAVEAARAGQHGKGFAVVAEEVRNLAARSADAAKETTTLIEGSIKKADGGTKIANMTATALNEIVTGVAKVAELVGRIAAASNEQAMGLAQINQGISQVAEVVQTNSATSEESAAASEELSGQAELLKQMIGRFHLKKNPYEGNRLGGLQPDLLKMLENMSEKKKNGCDPQNPVRIALSDEEFDDKY
jgi:methyl-accepting chemotaxis protein